MSEMKHVWAGTLTSDLPYGKKLDMNKYKALLADCKDDKEFRRRLKSGEADKDSEQAK